MLKNNEERAIINANIDAAIRGRKVYQKILRNFVSIKMRKINDWDSAVLLFPSHDNEINYYGILHVEEFMFRTNLKRLAIITSDEKVHKVFQELYPENKDFYLIADEEMKDILFYYRLYPFDNRIKVVSLDEPLGRRATNLLGIKNITKEMLISIGVFSLIPFKEMSPNTKEKKKIMSIFNEGKKI